MTFQFGTTLRNNQAAQIQTTVGSSATLVIYTGSEPANCAASATGTTLCTITLPATFLTSSGGVASLSGTWSANATATGTAGYYRILDGSSVCHMQGNCTSDLVLNNTSIASGQTVTITSYTVTMQNQ